jgi:hypothetical protein
MVNPMQTITKDKQLGTKKAEPKGKVKQAERTSELPQKEDPKRIPQGYVDPVIKVRQNSPTYPYDWEVLQESPFYKKYLGTVEERNADGSLLGWRTDAKEVDYDGAATAIANKYRGTHRVWDNTSQYHSAVQPVQPRFSELNSNVKPVEFPQFSFEEGVGARYLPDVEYPDVPTREETVLVPEIVTQLSGICANGGCGGAHVQGMTIGGEEHLQAGHRLVPVLKSKIDGLKKKFNKTLENNLNVGEASVKTYSSHLKSNPARSGELARETYRKSTAMLDPKSKRFDQGIMEAMPSESEFVRMSRSVASPTPSRRITNVIQDPVALEAFNKAQTENGLRALANSAIDLNEAYEKASLIQDEAEAKRFWELWKERMQPSNIALPTVRY